MNHLRAGESPQWAELDMNVFSVWCDRDKLHHCVTGLDNPKGCIGGNKSKYTVHNHNLLPSYKSLENMNHK